MGKEELREKFKNFLREESDEDTIVFHISTHFAGLEGTLNFKENKYIIECLMDEYSYCDMVMKDIEEMDKDDCENCYAWNTIDEYDNVEDALERLKEIITSLDSETDGSIEDEVINIIK